MEGGVRKWLSYLASKLEWLEFGDKNKLIRRDDCSCCVHQWCVGCNYKKAHNLAKVPFYCQEHEKKKQIRIYKINFFMDFIKLGKVM